MVNCDLCGRNIFQCDGFDWLHGALVHIDCLDEYHADIERRADEELRREQDELDLTHA